MVFDQKQQSFFLLHRLGFQALTIELLGGKLRFSHECFIFDGFLFYFLSKKPDTQIFSFVSCIGQNRQYQVVLASIGTNTDLNQKNFCQDCFSQGVGFAFSKYIMFSTRKINVSLFYHIFSISKLSTLLVSHI